MSGFVGVVAGLGEAYAAGWWILVNFEHFAVVVAEIDAVVGCSGCHAAMLVEHYVHINDRARARQEKTTQIKINDNKICEL